MDVGLTMEGLKCVKGRDRAALHYYVEIEVGIPEGEGEWENGSAWENLSLQTRDAKAVDDFIRRAQCWAWGVDGREKGVQTHLGTLSVFLANTTMVGEDVGETDLFNINFYFPKLSVDRDRMESRWAIQGVVSSEVFAIYEGVTVETLANWAGWTLV